MGSSVTSMAPQSAAETGGKPRIVVAGGFHGAGKTAALIRLGRCLRKAGKPVRMVIAGTGGDSVDAIRCVEHGFDTQAAKGSFPSPARLAELADAHPGVLLVEASGTAANLPAALDGVLCETCEVAPLTVVLDAPRAMRMLGLEGGSRFSKSIEALYRRQIQEASILVLQRSSMLSPRALNALGAALEKLTSARQLDLGKDEAAVEAWRAALESDAAGNTVAPSDEPALAEADRALATLSCVVKLSSVRYFDGNKVLLEIASLVQTLLGQEGAELAHLKSVLSSIDSGEHAAANAAASSFAPELIDSLGEPIQLGRMILNLRAEGDPEVLHSVVNRALVAVVEKSPELFARMEHSEHFRPDAALAVR